MTHLVQGPLEPTRKSLAKVKAAHAKRIPIVQVSFVHDSIANGMLMNVADYVE